MSSNSFHSPLNDSRNQCSENDIITGVTGVILAGGSCPVRQPLTDIDIAA